MEVLDSPIITQGEIAAMVASERAGITRRPQREVAEKGFHIDGVQGLDIECVVPVLLDNDSVLAPPVVFVSHIDARGCNPRRDSIKIILPNPGTGRPVADDGDQIQFFVFHIVEEGPQTGNLARGARKQHGAFLLKERPHLRIRSAEITLNIFASAERRESFFRFGVGMKDGKTIIESGSIYYATLIQDSFGKLRKNAAR